MKEKLPLVVFGLAILPMAHYLETVEKWDKVPLYPEEIYPDAPEKGSDSIFNSGTPMYAGEPLSATTRPLPPDRIMKKSKLTSKPPPQQNLTTPRVRYKYKYTPHITH